MGCDIHLVVEQKVGGQWIGLASTDYGWNPPCGERHYAFFTELCGVRGGGEITNNGLPKDISPLAKICLDGWDLDAHSKGHISVVDLEEKYEKVAGDRNALALSLGGGPEGDKLVRVVYWFDN
jgi:hypothetical protein